MLIHNHIYKINVQVLLMEHEIEVTKITLAGLLQQLQPEDSISVLLNGAVRPDFQELCLAHTGVNYYESPSNLGVAGGRNFLLETPEAKDSDIIMFVDNDVVVPVDYIEASAKFLLESPGRGVVGVIVLKYNELINHLNKVAPPFETYFGAEVWPISNSQIQDYLLKNSLEKCLFHIGTNPDWKSGYFESLDTLDQINVHLGIQSEKKFYSFLANDRQMRKRLKEQSITKIPVTNVPGCCQTFTRKLVDEIGLLNNLFSPYGFEDVDFCLRAIKAGYENFVSTNSYLIHGTDDRHKTRLKKQSIHRRWRNDSRCRTIFEHLWFPDDYSNFVMKRVLSNYILEWLSKSNRATERLAAEVSGIKDGLRQLVETYGDKIFDSWSQHNNNGWQNAYNSNPDSINLSVEKMLKAREGILTYQRERLWNGEVWNKSSLNKEPVKPPELDKNYWKRLRSFHNLHWGKRCFIVGNGPSLKKTDISLLHNEVTFAVNSFYYMTDEVGFQPTYYVVEDNHVIDDNLDRIHQIKATAKFFPDKYAHLIRHDENVFFMPTDWSCYFTSKPEYQYPKFSDDISQKIYTGQSVTYLNLQIAYYMGFSQVYIIGLDFSYEIPKNIEVSGCSITSLDDDPNHFHPEYFGKGKKWHFPKLNSCLNSYRNAKFFYEERGRKVYNATIGGRLGIYDRVDYYSLFDTAVRLDTPNKTLTYLLNQCLRGLIGTENRNGGKGCRYLEISTGKNQDVLQLFNTKAKHEEHQKIISLRDGNLKGIKKEDREGWANLESLKVAMIDLEVINQGDMEILQLATRSLSTNAVVFIDNLIFSKEDRKVNGWTFLQSLFEQVINCGKFLYVFNSVGVLLESDRYDFLELWSPGKIKANSVWPKVNPLHLMLMLRENQFSNRWYRGEVLRVITRSNSIMDWNDPDVGKMLYCLAQNYVPFVANSHSILFKLERL